MVDALKTGVRRTRYKRLLFSYLRAEMALHGLISSPAAWKGVLMHLGGARLPVDALAVHWACQADETFHAWRDSLQHSVEGDESQFSAGT